MINILIADDHPIIRQGLKLIISDEEGMKVLDEAENGQQVFDFLKNDFYDILILDLCLPDMSGMEVLKRVTKLYPGLSVLILSALPEDIYAVNLIKSGAKGYVNKIAATEQLITAIKKILSGKLYINPALSEKLIPEINNDNNGILRYSLSDRELEVLRSIASGKTVKSISNNLTISIPTVYKYKAQIYKKMKLKNDSELIRYCIKEGLLLN